MAKKSETKGAEPMDSGAPERKTGAVMMNRQRNAYALDTLIEEVEDLFPEAEWVTGSRDGRGTALSVEFDTSLMQDDAGAFALLMSCIGVDARVATVAHKDGALAVALFSNPRTQDSRKPFNLADAWMVLVENDEGSL